MKVLSLFVIACCFFLSCSKIDFRKSPQKNKCDIANQTITHYEDAKPYTYSAFKEKTYYANGLPKTLKYVLTGTFGDEENLEYTFDYTSNTVIVHAKSTKWDPEQGQDVTTIYDFDVKFDLQTGYATQVGSSTVQYENKRVKTFGPHKFEYDSYGNLVLILRSGVINPSADGGVRYTYDLTKKSGGQEFYRINIANFGTEYNLAEIMSWIPMQSPNRRTGFSHFTGDYQLDSETYSDHQYQGGKLTKFKVKPGGYVNPADVKNTWNCLK
ncbi:MAG: hypothetical protein J7497_10245 [Chitinophagaceae bacterium]|nr:hypothetical protein [Chitinophagaceae bacterium]